jgi:N-acetyl-gamma-glutamyl-phosphate/LysW-gamma-L-alpha-aminoadipyl-6-phosphate reductase
MSIATGIIGASGFAGGELARLLAGHPEFGLCYASVPGHSPDLVGKPLAAVHPHLRAGRAVEALPSKNGGSAGSLELVSTKTSEAARRCEVVFLATPPLVSAALGPALLAAGVEVVVDLSPAFRLRDPALHSKWYPAVSRPPERTAVYGLPELNRALLPGADLIAAPGCLATAAILALMPLSGLDGVRLSSITIDGKAGSTGSGHRLRSSGLHPVRSGVVAPYAPAGHRHVAEIQEALLGKGLATVGGGLRLGMSVFGVDLVRGVSVAAHVIVDPDSRLPSEGELASLYRDAYRDAAFVRVIHWREEAVPLPDPKTLTGSNYCDIAVFQDADCGRLVIVAALDNLMKGAAGQAIQACNIRYGLPETLGIDAFAVYPG